MLQYYDMHLGKMALQITLSEDLSTYRHKFLHSCCEPFFIRYVLQKLPKNFSRLSIYSLHVYRLYLSTLR